MGCYSTKKIQCKEKEIRLREASGMVGCPKRALWSVPRGECILCVRMSKSVHASTSVTPKHVHT